jgi:hypothetical protein
LVICPNNCPIDGGANLRFNLPKGDNVEKAKNETVSPNEPTGLEVLGIVLTSPFIILIQTWIMRLLWGWFITPSLHIDVPRFVYVAGIMLMFDFQMCGFAKDEGKGKPLTSEWFVAVIGKYFGQMTFFLVVGWIIHLFA